MGGRADVYIHSMPACHPIRGPGFLRAFSDLIRNEHISLSAGVMLVSQNDVHHSL